ncbi:unnamed protein product [Xylocopa violacea]|uniref:tRNA/rRNA methyltransferase SpoU type domain-containing protein n=1 Tax=Xylocopa violacea TaxID=135666 RepID=A0ABP1NW99_XYLVO
MDLHERYIQSSTIDFSIFELLETAFKDNPFLLLHRLTKHYNTEIVKNNFDAKQLNTLRIILCYEYQLVFYGKEKRTRNVQNDLCFKTIESTLWINEQSQNFINNPILYDIVVLQLTLYCNTQCIEQHLINFKKSNADILNYNENKIFYFKILECFLECLKLRKFLYNNLEPNFLKHFSSLYLKDLTLWLELRQNKEWQLFISILPKLINIFDSNDILPVLWDCILNLTDTEDALSAISIVIDICFSPNSKNTSFRHHELCYREQLWLLIVKNLQSPIQQYRKQALFIMKRITDFMNTTDANSLIVKKHKTVPFLCNQSIKTKISIIDIKQNFFLIVEALEEKQRHLILPALAHLPILTKGNIEHAMCNDCFSSIWLQFIFKRILQHENNAVVKQGILNLCELPDLMYDDQFLTLLIHALNNTFLYEHSAYGEQPKILNDIIKLFTHIQEEQDEFLCRVFQVMNKELSWSPIPIFYMIIVLRIVSSQISNHWGNKQLSLIKSLIHNNINKYSYVLKSASKIELLEIVSLSVERITDLKSVVDTLFEFPSTILRENMLALLQKILVKTDAINFIRLMCEEYSSQDSQIKTSAATFAIMINMFHDTGLMLEHRTCPIEEVLSKWLSLLKGIDVRPYANIEHIYRIVVFMSSLLHSHIEQSHKCTAQLLSLYINDAMMFLLKHSRNMLYKISYQEIHEYCNVTIIFFNKNLISSKNEILNYTEKLKNECIFILKNIKQYTSIHYVYALNILYHTQNILCTNHTSFYMQPLINICDIQISDKGKIASICYKLLANLVNQYLSKVEIELWSKNVDWFESISNLYEMEGSEIIPEIALILETMVNKGAMKNSKNRSNFESIFSMCWRDTLLGTKNETYFLAMKNLVGVIMNNNLLVLPNIMSFIDNFLDDLLEEAKNVRKLKIILIKKIKLLDVHCLRNLQKPLLSGLLHGQILQRDEEIENQAYLYIITNYKNYDDFYTKAILHNDDYYIRAVSAVLLHKIISEDRKYASMLLQIILQKLENYKNKRYFNHSYVHKIKHRIMQILLIIQPVLFKEDTIILQEYLCNLIVLESNQHSVRLMQEWILIKIFLENTDLHGELWKLFEKGITTRPGCVKSIACIVYHVTKLLPKNFEFILFVRLGFYYIVRCCLGQQYSMRLYSQIIFVKLYEMLNGLNYDKEIISQYKDLYCAVNLNLENGLAKNSRKIQDDFYFSTFHPLQHYTLETIYLELPRLSGMDENEWITALLFKSVDFKVTNSHPLQLYNSDKLLSLSTTSYLINPTGDAEASVTNCNTKEFEEQSNIQKKMNPSNLSHSDIFPTIRESICHRRISDEKGLIVVACLIDRTPNLGGLARTCEIFNAKELVIANLSQVKSKEFQNLSVSAENWITITETKPHELCNYLLNKKDTGYSLVGVEQTVNSTNLLNMKFEKKTILVLGNEKDGIPANLIPLFDTCIEIPQAGVIRSLNVHVTGAICIWQYAKQHVFT